jgi:hypothetical protein
VRKNSTHTAVSSTGKTYLGMATRLGIRVWEAIHIEYIVGIMLPATLKLSSAIKTFPNPPTGLSMALRSPATFPSAKPASQSGTEDADIAAAAPRHWRVIY